MIHGHEDLFVGSVAILLGSLLVGCAITNWSWYYSLRTAQLLERVLGRSGVRIFHALLGLAIIALGVAIARGHRLPLFSQ